MRLDIVAALEKNNEKRREKLTSFIVRRILSNFIHQGRGGTPVFMGKYLVHTRLDFIFGFHLIESEGGYSEWKLSKAKKLINDEANLEIRWEGMNNNMIKLNSFE